MRWTLVTCGLLLALGSGCASGFEGEWLEDAGQHDTGNMLTEGGERRMALKFDTPAWVQTGLYLDHMGVVDEQTVQNSRYFLFDGWKVAQFGAMTARIDGEHAHLVAGVQGAPERRFTKVKGKSIFPPRAILPPVGMTDDPLPSRLAFAPQSLGDPLISSFLLR